MTRIHLCATIALAIAASGCDGSKASGGDDTEANDRDDRKAKTQPSSAKPRASARAKDLGPAKLPPGRSLVPTAKEWNAVGEVTVKGSTALNCETKMVREWLRVSCRGKNDTGGTPTDVMVTSGERAGVFVLASGGVTSLVMPFVAGTDLEARFSWTDKSHPLKVRWPSGAPKPTIIGTFEGARSPLDARDHGREERFQEEVCECVLKRPGYTRQDCGSWVYNEDCRRTYYPHDCATYLVCLTGHPGAPPDCPGDEKPGFMNVCGAPTN